MSVQAILALIIFIINGKPLGYSFIKLRIIGFSFILIKNNISRKIKNIEQKIL